MHPNEVALVFITPSKKILPTPEFTTELNAAQALGEAYVEAVQSQAERQMGFSYSGDVS